MGAAAWIEELTMRWYWRETTWWERTKGALLLIAGLGLLTWLVNHQVQEYRRDAAALAAWQQCQQRQLLEPRQTRVYDPAKCLVP
jgi:hypothetical protein